MAPKNTHRLNRMGRLLAGAWTTMALGCAAEPAPTPVTAAEQAPPREAARPAAGPLQAFAEAGVPYRFTDPDRRKKIERAMAAIGPMMEEARRTHEVPSIAYALVVDGDVVLAAATGVADIESKTPATADTIYRIGSITKSFTSIALLSLRDEGKISLDDPLARWIPEAAGIVYPARDIPPITLRQVMTHTAGLPRVGQYDNTQDVAVTEAEILASLTGAALEHPPGTKWVYSNFGYHVLGLVAARAAGEDYRALVQKRVLDPIGMTSSTLDFGAVDKARFATPTAKKKHGPVKVPLWNVGASMAGGGIFSSARDMARYLAFELDAWPPRDGPETYPLTRRSSRREAVLSALPSDLHVSLRDAKPGEPILEADARSYGFGWHVKRTCEIPRVVSHTGGVDGFSAAVEFLPDHGIAFVALSNLAHSNMAPVVDEVLTMLVHEAHLKPRAPEIHLAPAFKAAVDGLLGAYETWDEHAYQALFPPHSPPIKHDDHEEFAALKRLHGRCSGFKPSHVTTPFVAKVMLTCEKGKIEVEADVDTRHGKLRELKLTSHDAPLDPALAKAAARIAGLVKRWEGRDLPGVKPGAETAEREAAFAKLRAAHGACEVEAPLDRDPKKVRFRLACDKGGDLELTLHVEGAATGAEKLTGFKVGAGPKGQSCPRRRPAVGKPALDKAKQGHTSE